MYRLDRLDTRMKNNMMSPNDLKISCLTGKKTFGGLMCGEIEKELRRN